MIVIGLLTDTKYLEIMNILDHSFRLSLLNANNQEFSISFFEIMGSLIFWGGEGLGNATAHILLNFLHILVS